VVSDPSGAVVPNAKVVVKHEQTGVVNEAQSSGDGNFRVPNLPVGTYTVTVSAPGFKASESTGVPVDINTTAALNVTLLPGAISETVSVAADAPTVQSESSEIGTTVNARQVLQLPLAVNGVGGLRSPEAFVFLTPGTVGPGSATDNGANGDNPSSNNGGAFQSKISGSQNFANEVLVDGASMFRSENGSSFDETAQSVESIEEFRVQTSTYPAEYGRTGGGVTSFVTKSGTNKFHGDVYDFFRNRELDANRFFNNAFGTLRPLDNHNDFGATLGGPIWLPKVYKGTDRTFFFFSYEGFRRSAGGPIISTLPTAQYLQGNFSSLLTNQQIGTDALGRPIYRGQIFNPASPRPVNGQIVRDPFPGNVIQPSQFSTVAKNVLALIPQPTTGGTFQNYVYNGKTPITANTYTTKVDHNFSEKNRIGAVWTWRRNDRSAGDPNLPAPITMLIIKIKIKLLAR